MADQPGTPDRPARAGGLLYTAVKDESLTVLNAATGKSAYDGWSLGIVDDRHPVLAYQLDGGALRAYAP